MMNSLQDLIDASIFISTEYQARLAELVGTSEWNVDFTSQSLDFETTPPLSLKPHLLGTESENRGTWIWSWQQLGYFPDSVVSAAIQARETGERDGLAELTTDELPLSESLARRLTLATKTISGLYAHYPLPAGAGVRAWTLLEGAELTLEAPTYKGIGRVIAKTLQSEEIHNQVLAVDSYAQQRGFHIAWDTEATAVLTATDGALRLWFDEGRISGIEQAEPQVGPEVLEQCAAAAAQRRESLALIRTEIECIAAAEAAAQSAQREQEAAERAAARAQVESERAAQLAAEAEAERAAQLAAKAEADRTAQLAAEAHVLETYEVPGLERTENFYPADEAHFDQEPAEHAQSGYVTVETLPNVFDTVVKPPVNQAQPEQARVYTDASIGSEAPIELPIEAPSKQADFKKHHYEEAAPVESLEVIRELPTERVEPIRNAGEAPDLQAEHEEAARREQEEAAHHETETKKKGFFSRFFGL